MKRLVRERITDKLGKGVDTPIIDLVALLFLFGFSPGFSCGGHVRPPGLAYPWIALEPWEQKTRKGKEEIRKRTLSQAASLYSLIERCYLSEGQPPYHEMLVVVPGGGLASIRLVPTIVAAAAHTPRKDSVQYGRRAMNHLVRYLKKSYLTQEA